MPRSLKIEESEHPADAYLDFSSDKETSYADELQSWLEDISLCGHEAIEVVLSVVVCLPA